MGENTYSNSIHMKVTSFEAFFFAGARNAERRIGGEEKR
jgi:hypothetical protein